MFIEIKNWNDTNRRKRRTVECVQKLNMIASYDVTGVQVFLIWVNDKTLVYKTEDEAKAQKIFTHLTGLLTGIQNCLVKVSVYNEVYSIVDPSNMERCS